MRRAGARQAQAEGDREHETETMERWRKGKWERRMQAAPADTWLIEWRLVARGHTYVNCSFVVHCLPELVHCAAGTHRTIRLNGPKVACSRHHVRQRRWVTASVFHPCLPQQDCWEEIWLWGAQMTFWGLRSADFWHYVEFRVVGVFFVFKCFVAHKPHFPFECLCGLQSIHNAQSSALRIRRRNHPTCCLLAGSRHDSPLVCRCVIPRPT